MIDGLLVADEELPKRLNVPAGLILPILSELEAKHGFPQKIKLWGGRRYWPAVQAWFDEAYGRKMAAPSQPRSTRYG